MSPFPAFGKTENVPILLRTYMYLLRAAHLGEVSVTVWPEVLKRICAEHNIHVLE